MAVTPLAALHRKLFDETDGNKFARLKDRLIKKHGMDERRAVLDILIGYARDGQLLHWRNFLMTDILALAEPGECGDFFTGCLAVPELSYWAVDGMLKSMGKTAYGPLVALAAADAARSGTRAKAIKSLAVFSGQPFDRGLMTDPGHWKPEQLRVAEVLAWQADGYPDGHGFAAPATHGSLDDPRTALEKAAAKLEKKLAAERKKDQDLALGGWGKHDTCKATSIVAARAVFDSVWHRAMGHGGTGCQYLSRHRRSRAVRNESATAGDTDRP